LDRLMKVSIASPIGHFYGTLTMYLTLWAVLFTYTFECLLRLNFITYLALINRYWTCRNYYSKIFFVVVWNFCEYNVYFITTGWNNVFSIFLFLFIPIFGGNAAQVYTEFDQACHSYSQHIAIEPTLWLC
jgi:hypothetical protein